MHRPKPLLRSAAVLTAGIALALSGIGTAAAPRPASTAPSAPSPDSAAVDWRPGGSDVDLAAAFAEAADRGQPLLMFWGARWCPPCNRLKATLFRQADFVALSRTLVPVEVDGDAPGAQRIGSRFQVRGYPTLVLFSPQGREVTRLPGEVEPTQVLRAVQAALAGGRPVADLIADVRAGRSLTRNEWRMLAFFSWEAASADGVAETQRPALLAELAVAAARSAGQPLRTDAGTAGVAGMPMPTAGSSATGADADSALRLLWKALALATPQQGLVADAPIAERVAKLLADPAAARRHADLMLLAGDDVVRRLAPEPGAERRAWVSRTDAALARLQADATLARGDRLMALMTRVELARLEERTAVQPASMRPALVREVRETVERLDRELSDPFERQAVVPSAAHALSRVGLWRESEALLQANLARVGEPYALMSQLASQARAQGRPDDALRWSEQAFDRSRGPATRLQWGASYLSMLADLAPGDTERFERTAARLLQEAAGDPGAFHERSECRAVVQRLAPARQALCAAQPAGSRERARCDSLWPAA
jgi:thiol-disulfide isomerase/thioredoxin